MLNADLHTSNAPDREVRIRTSHHDRDRQSTAFAVLKLESFDKGRQVSQLNVYVHADDAGEKFLADLAAEVYQVQKILAAKREADESITLDGGASECPTVEITPDEAREARESVKQLVDSFCTDLGVAAHG